MKGWVGLVGWPVADGLPTLVVTHQLQIVSRTNIMGRRDGSSIFDLADNIRSVFSQFLKFPLDGWRVYCRFQDMMQSYTLLGTAPVTSTLYALPSQARLYWHYSLCLASILIHVYSQYWTDVVNSLRWLGSRVVSMLDSGAEGLGFKSQPRRCWVTVLRVSGVTAGLAESNGSLLPGLWLTSAAGWLPRTRISSGTIRSVFEYGQP